MNKITVIGTEDGAQAQTYTRKGEIFYTISLLTARKSGAVDKLSVVIPGVILQDLNTDDKIKICGEVRTRMDREGHKIIYVFAKSVENTKEEDCNIVEVMGKVCTRPYYRETPKGRQITEITVLTCRKCGVNDFVPCIAWGRQAHMAALSDLSADIYIRGRLQSRDYNKCTDEGNIIKTAYEVSANEIVYMDYLNTN